MTAIPFNPDHLYLYGYSDDLITFDGCLSEEIERYNGDIRFTMTDDENNFFIIKFFRNGGPWKAEIKYNDLAFFDINIHQDCKLVDGTDEIVEIKNGNVLVEIRNKVTEISYKNYIRYDDKQQVLNREWRKEGTEK